jgi:hypothetical protein
VTAAERKDLRDLVEALRQEMRDEITIIKQRIDALEKPRVARVVIDPSRPADGS